MAQTRFDFARQALQKMGWNEAAAINWLGQSCVAHAEVRQAFGTNSQNLTELKKRVTPVVRKMLKEHLEREGS